VYIYGSYRKILILIPYYHFLEHSVYKAKWLGDAWRACGGRQRIMPNTHRRRRRDETVELHRVAGVNRPVGSRDPVYNFLC